MLIFKDILFKGPFCDPQPRLFILFNSLRFFIAVEVVRYITVVWKIFLADLFVSKICTNQMLTVRKSN